MQQLLRVHSVKSPMPMNVNLQRPFTIHRGSRRYGSSFKLKVLQEANKKGVMDKLIIEKYGLNKRGFYRWKRKGYNHYVEYQYGLHRRRGQTFNVEEKKRLLLLPKGSQRDNRTMNGSNPEWSGLQVRIGKKCYKLTLEMQALHDRECGFIRRFGRPGITPVKKMRQFRMGSFFDKRWPSGI